MKNIAITCFVLIAVCVGLQAKKVVKAPFSWQRILARSNSKK